MREHKHKTIGLSKCEYVHIDEGAKPGAITVLPSKEQEHKIREDIAKQASDRHDSVIMSALLGNNLPMIEGK